jgi:hypothetical protein
VAVRFPPRRGSTLIAVLLSGFEQVYDPSETRLLISHASPGREGLLSQLALVLKADLTVSAGLHFRYGVSYNEFSVQHDPDAFRTKLEAARKAFNEIWEAVKNQVEGVVECVLPCRFFPPDRRPALLLIKTTTARAHSESQRTLLQNALAVANRVPANNFVGGAANVEEAAWKNCWNWCVLPPSSVPLSTCARCGQILSLLVAFPSDRNLPDAQYGNLILDVRDGRMGSEMKSQGEHRGARPVAAHVHPLQN